MSFLRFLILLLLYSVNSFAQKQPLFLFEELQKKINSMGQKNQCFVDEEERIFLSESQSYQDPCTDLYTAACISQDGKNIYKEKEKEISLESQKKIRAAQDLTSINLGFESFEHALKEELKKNGLEVMIDHDKKEWEKMVLFESKYGFQYVSAETKKIFKDSFACHAELDGFYESIKKSDASEEELLDLHQKIINFEQKYSEKITNFYTKDIIRFYNNLSDKCLSLERNSESYLKEDNVEVAAVCDKIDQIKIEAIHIYKLEGTSSYEKKAVDFVNKYQKLELKSKHSNQAYPYTKNKDLNEVYEKVRSKYLCNDFDSLIRSAARRKVMEYSVKINTNKTTVDKIIDTYYTDEKKKKVSDFFEDVKSEMKSILKHFVDDKSKLSRIVSSFEDFHLFWLEKPSMDLYKKDSSGQFLLDQDKMPLGKSDYNHFDLFSDPSLSEFIELNANYSAHQTEGVTESKERVNMMPAMLQVMDEYPFGFIEVLAHEVGHKIGYEVSKINGYDLESEYKDLLNCYRDSQSIKMKNNQADETLSDYFSSEVITSLLMKYPMEKRRDVLFSALKLSCIFDNNNSLSINATHPEEYLRVNGIFGANPNLRDAIGCKENSSVFKTCGLKKLRREGEKIK